MLPDVIEPLAIIVVPFFIVVERLYPLGVDPFALIVTLIARPGVPDTVPIPLENPREKLVWPVTTGFGLIVHPVLLGCEFA